MRIFTFVLLIALCLVVGTIAAVARPRFDPYIVGMCPTEGKLKQAIKYLAEVKHLKMAVPKLDELKCTPLPTTYLYQFHPVFVSMKSVIGPLKMQDGEYTWGLVFIGLEKGSKKYYYIVYAQKMIDVKRYLD